MPGAVKPFDAIPRLEGAVRSRPPDPDRRPDRRWWSRALCVTSCTACPRHPLHPVLVQVPLGAWTGVAILDLIPGARRASDALVATGIAAALPARRPAWWTGPRCTLSSVEWGVVHVASNRLGRVVRRVPDCADPRSAGTRANAVLPRLRRCERGGHLGGHLAYRLAGRYQPRRSCASSCPTAGTTSHRRRPDRRQAHPASARTVPLVAVRDGQAVRVLVRALHPPCRVRCTRAVSAARTATTASPARGMAASFDCATAKVVHGHGNRAAARRSRPSSTRADACWSGSRRRRTRN